MAMAMKGEEEPFSADLQKRQVRLHSLIFCQYSIFCLFKKKHFQYIFFFPMMNKFGLFLRDCLSKLWTNRFGRFHSNRHQCGVDPEEKTCSETLKMAQWI